tara:strand:+ start:1368 stop:1634 length:267 start_codon:yes stop_codon:yes gene_type:complete
VASDFTDYLSDVEKAFKTEREAIDELRVKEPQYRANLLNAERIMNEIDGEGLTEQEIEENVESMMENNPFRLSLKRAQIKRDEVISNG